MMNVHNNVRQTWPLVGQRRFGPRPFPRAIIVCCSLLVILSGCSSLFSNSQATTPTAGVAGATPTTALTTDSDIAHALVQKMSLDEKLGQMVIVEFYGATLNADLMQMITGNHIGGVLIEDKNGNAQTREQLVKLEPGDAKPGGHSPVDLHGF